MARSLDRLAAVAGLGCVLGLTIGAQVPTQDRPTFTSGTDLVVVDVTVLGRDGSPIATLTADDFTLLVDGAPRRIASARFVRADQGASPAAPPSDPLVGAVPQQPRDPASRRVFVLVVDREHIPVGEGQQMLEAGARFIASLPATDRVALWALPARSGGLRFNEDRAAMQKAIRETVGTYRSNYGPWMVGRDEAIRADEQRPNVLQNIITRECYKQGEGCPPQVEAQVQQTAADARQRADATLASLGDLVDALAAIEGPKQVVLVTGGPVRTLANFTSITRLAQRASLARVTLHALQVVAPSYQARTDQMRAQPEEIEQAASAAYMLAGTTGGLAITPTSGNVAFQQLARQLAGRYVLTFETEPADRDAEPHKIDVGLRNPPFGTVVRARDSFRAAPTSFAAEPAAAQATTPGETAAPTSPTTTAPATPAPAAALVGSDPGELAERLAAYAEAFERELSAVVAEERYVQIIHPWRGNPRGPDAEPSLVWREAGQAKSGKGGGPTLSRRQLLSDVLAVQLGQQWLTFRDVAEVDGDAVRARTDRVRAIFLAPASDRDAQFRRIAAESARYNLGDLRRDLNLPTVTLSLLRRQNHARFEFKRGKDEDVDGVACRVLTYRETVKPTLIATVNSGDVFIYGRVWLDRTDGRVRRTELRFDRGGGKRSSIRVDFQAQPGLGVLVPASMWEWYEGADQLGRIGGDVTVIEGLAKYSNVRKYEVTTSEIVK